MRIIELTALTVFLLSGCLTSSPVSIRSPNPESYVARTDIQEILRTEAGRWNQFLGIPIEPNRVGESLIIVVSDLEWDESSDHPVRGTWIVRYTLDDGPENLWYNTGFRALGGQPPHVMTMAMGESLTTRELFDDAVGDVLNAVQMKLEGDGLDIRIDASGKWKPVVAYTFLVKPPPVDEEGSILGPWREKWVVRMNCVDVEAWIDFIPAATGGTCIVVTTETGNGPAGDDEPEKAERSGNTGSGPSV